MPDARLALLAAPLAVTIAVTAELLTSRPLSPWSADWWVLTLYWSSAPAQAYAFYLRFFRENILRITRARTAAKALAVFSSIPWLVGTGVLLWSFGLGAFLGGVCSFIFLGLAARRINQAP